MKQLFSVLGVCLVLLVSMVAYWWLTYDAQYNAVRDEIATHSSLQIVDQWRHEDVSLEDFGFTIRSPRATLQLNIHDGSSVRIPSDHAVGIAYRIPGETFQAQNTFYSIQRLIRFDSPEWKQRGLPPVHTLADVIANFDAIAMSLQQSPPSRQEWSFEPHYIFLAPPR